MCGGKTQTAFLHFQTDYETSSPIIHRSYLVMIQTMMCILITMTSPPPMGKWNQWYKWWFWWWNWPKHTINRWPTTQFASGMGIKEWHFSYCITRTSYNPMSMICPKTRELCYIDSMFLRYRCVVDFISVMAWKTQLYPMCWCKYERQFTKINAYK